MTDMSNESKQQYESQLIESELNKLLVSARRVTTEDNIQQIIKAFHLANNAHQGMIRKSGEPYIIHPISVARIVADEIGLGSKSIIAALLHDVVEDTDITLEDIDRQFGKKVASIVDGLTKLSTTSTTSRSQQADNFRKLLLSMIDDTRVILIKLADRLHNMRTLDSMPEYKQFRIAGETLFIYAPLAHRLGLYSIKSELEDLSLKHEHPKLYNELKEKLKTRQTSTQYLTDSFIAPISARLRQNGFDFEVKSRPKSIYSIWSKMVKKNVPFEEVYDISAIRIVFTPKVNLDEKAQCWAIYSLVTDIYKPKPDRLRDWISSPKANGYEALHSTVMSAQGKWVEIQIRSQRMDEVAERGFAAHYKYKEQHEKESELDVWIRHIRELLDNPDPDSLEFLDAFKLNLSSAEMMIFTPDGDVHNMPSGVSVLDFAYEIHSNLGNKCIGAKVNSKLVPLNHILKSGDQVEILTSESQTPKYEWLQVATTAKARTRIKEAFKKERKELIDKGERIIEEELNKLRLTTNARILKKILTHFNLTNKEDLCFGLGKGTIILESLEKILATKTENKWVKYWTLSFITNSGKSSNTKDEENESLEESSNNEAAKSEKKSNPKMVNINEEIAPGNFTRATCCNPIPGDDVVGFYDEEDKIILHSRKCDIAIKLMSSMGDKMVNANWTTHKLLSFIADIKITGLDQMGIVSKITKIISEEKHVNIRALHFESFDGIFDGNITLYIPSTQDLDNLIETLKKIKGVHSVMRIEKNEK